MKPEPLTRVTTSHRLYGTTTFEEGQTPIRALLFGQLVDLSHGTVEHYRSDYYHNAHWIKEHVEGPTTFYFGFDEWGTALNENAREAAYARRKNLYRVTLRAELGEWEASGEGSGRATWWADITRLTDEEVAEVLA